MQVYLVRHTSVIVPSVICYGQSDIDLADTFESEAKQIIQKIGPEHFDAVYSSPLKRCTLLAQKLSNIEISVDNRLMELHFGKWEMLPWEEIKGEYADKWMADFVHVECPGGESYFQLFERAKEFLHELKLNSYKHALVVTHGGTIRALLALINNTKLEDSFKTNVPFGHIEKIEI